MNDTSLFSTETHEGVSYNQWQFWPMHVSDPANCTPDRWQTNGAHRVQKEAGTGGGSIDE